jgi:uncharacterized membrane protein YhdT
LSWVLGWVLVAALALAASPFVASWAWWELAVAGVPVVFAVGGLVVGFVSPWAVR